MIEQASAADHLHRLLSATWDPSATELPGPIPWAAVADLAQTGGVAPLLHAAIQQTGSGVREQVRQDLRQIYLHTAAANVRRYVELERILEAVAPLDTPLLLLKGAALAETLYDNIALRAMEDLDVVVPRESAVACQEQLVRMGYAPFDVEETPGSRLEYRAAQAFLHPASLHARVGLHWHLIDIPYYVRKVPMDWFWENSESIQLAGNPVRVLNDEANLLYLPAHLALHHRLNPHGLRWFVDIALLVHRGGKTTPWNNIIAAAKDFELLLVLRETLDRLSAIWPSLPLAEPRQQLRAMQPTAFEARLFRLVTAEPRGPLLDFWADVLSLPNSRSRLRFILTNLFPQRAYMVRRYGVKRPWYLPYWYLYRLGDGLVKAVRTWSKALGPFGTAESDARSL